MVNTGASSVTAGLFFSSEDNNQAQMLRHGAVSARQQLMQLLLKQKDSLSFSACALSFILGWYLIPYKLLRNPQDSVN